MHSQVQTVAAQLEPRGEHTRWPLSPLLLDRYRFSGFFFLCLWNRDGDLQHTVPELGCCIVDLGSLGQWNRAKELSVATFRMKVSFALLFLSFSFQGQGVVGHANLHVIFRQTRKIYSNDQPALRLLYFDSGCPNTALNKRFISSLS